MVVPMTPELRQEKARALIGLLAERIAGLAPADVLTWPGSGITDGPTAALLIALTAWEAEPTDGASQLVTSAYEDLLRAWRYVAADFNEQTDVLA